MDGIAWRPRAWTPARRAIGKLRGDEFEVAPAMIRSQSRARGP